MNETLIDNWNKKVGPQDIIFLLGDFAFLPQNEVKEILDRLNGNIHLCRGNHDKPLNSLYHYFSSVFDLKTILVPDDEVPNGLQPIVLCHYPLLSFDRQFYKSIMLHGHSHGSIPFDPTVRRIDIGVDCWNYSPVSYREISEFVKFNCVYS